MSSVIQVVNKIHRPCLALKINDGEISIVHKNRKLEKTDVDVEHLVYQNGSFLFFCKDLFQLKEDRTLSRTVVEEGSRLELYGYYFDKEHILIQIEQRISGTPDGAEPLLYSDFIILKNKVLEMDEEIDKLKFSVEEIEKREILHGIKITKLLEDVELIGDNDFIKFTQNFSGWKSFVFFMLLFLNLFFPDLTYHVKENTTEFFEHLIK